MNLDDCRTIRRAIKKSITGVRIITTCSECNKETWRSERHISCFRYLAADISGFETTYKLHRLYIDSEILIIEFDDQCLKCAVNSTSMYHYNIGDYAIMYANTPVLDDSSDTLEVSIINVNGPYIKGKGQLRELIASFDKLKEEVRQDGYTHLVCQVLTEDGRGSTRTKVYNRAGFKEGSNKGLLEMAI